MMFTGRAARLPEWEQGAILAAARVMGIDARFLAAIRIAENGGPGREYGVLSTPAPTYYDQLAIAAQSVKNSLKRYNRPLPPDGRLSPGFIIEFAARWAPQDAENDPAGLNTHWVRNVTAAYLESGVAW